MGGKIQIFTNFLHGGINNLDKLLNQSRLYGSQETSRGVSTVKLGNKELFGHEKWFTVAVVPYLAVP